MLCPFKIPFLISDNKVILREHSCMKYTFNFTRAAIKFHKCHHTNVDRWKFKQLRNFLYTYVHISICFCLLYLLESLTSMIFFILFSLSIYMWLQRGWFKSAIQPICCWICKVVSKLRNAEEWKSRQDFRLKGAFNNHVDRSGRAWTLCLPPTPCSRGHLENDPKSPFDL